MEAGYRPGQEEASLGSCLVSNRKSKGLCTGDFNSDDGMTTLLTKLDSVILKEEKDRQYTEFDRITRENGVSMVDYIVEFERRYNRISKFKM